MSRRASKLLAFIFAAVVAAGFLLPAKVAHAADYVQAGTVSTVRATASIVAPTVDADVVVPDDFTLVSPTDQGVRIPSSMVRWEKKNPDTNKWSEYRLATFDPGTYRLSVQVRSQKLADNTYYRLTSGTKVYVNDVAWTTAGDVQDYYADDGYGYMTFSSAEYTLTGAAKYLITVKNDDGMGTATASVPSAASGTEVTLTATPKSTFYKLKNWEVVSGGVTIVGDTFTMGSQDVVIKAHFEPTGGAHAGDISQVRATATITAPTVGSAVVLPDAFTITSPTGQGVRIPSSMVSWYKKTDDSWFRYDEPTFEAGTYTLHAQLRSQALADNTYWKLTNATRVYVNDVEWTNKKDLVDRYDSNGYGTLNIVSPEWTIPSSDPVTSYEVWVGGVEVTSANKDDIWGDGKAKYDPATKTLTFTGVTSLPGVHQVGTAPVNHYGVYATDDITVAGSATFTVDEVLRSYGIYSNGKLTIADGAQLTITSGYYALAGNNGGVVINGGTINLTSLHASTISALGTAGLTINGGTVNLVGNTSGIDARYKKVIINDGTVTISVPSSDHADNGIRVQGSGAVQINGGILDVTTKDGKQAVDYPSQVTYASTHEITEGALDSNHVRIAPKPAVTGISVASSGKVNYTVGDTLDLSGTTIKVDYSDGHSETIPVTLDMVSGFNSAAPADAQTLTITHEGKTTTYVVSIEAALTQFTVTFKDGDNELSHVTVDAGEKVSAPADPVKTDFVFDGWFADPTLTSAFDFTQAINANTTVYAKFYPLTVTGISVATSGKADYTVGDPLDVSGMTIKVEYSDGNSETIPVTDDMISGFDSSAPVSTQTLTITYEGKTVTCDISIVPKTYNIAMNVGAGGAAMPSDEAAESGTTINVTVTPDSGYEVEKVTYKPASGSETDITAAKSFVMPDEDVTVTVTFKKKAEEGASSQTSSQASSGSSAASSAPQAAWYAASPLSNVTRAATPAPAVAYTVTSGANTTWTKDSADNVTITVKRSAADDTCLSHFRGVDIDGKALVADKDYTAAAGSTVLTLKASALQQLSDGKHTVTVKFDDGEVATGLTVKAGEEPDNTDKAAATTDGGDEAPTAVDADDDSSVMPWVAFGLIALLALLLIIFLARKKRKEEEAQ